MKKKFLCTETVIYHIIFIMLIPSITVILLSIIFKDPKPLYALIFVLLYSLIIFMFRKYFFAKVEFNENGIVKKYRNKILVSISWNSLIKVMVMHNKYIYFLNKDLSKNELSSKFNEIIAISITKNKLNTFKNYLNYIHCNIEGLDYLLK